MMQGSHVEKMNQKKEFYDINTIQSIKSELLNNNTTLRASPKVLICGQEQNFNSIGNSYEDEDFNNDNIDVETDSDTDQQMTELKQMNYHNLSDVTVKNEEWSKIVKSTMMLKANLSPKTVASESDSPTLFSHVDDQQQQPANQHAKKVCISSDVKIDCDPDLEKGSDESRPNLKRVFLPDEDDTEYFNDSFTSHNLLNLSDRKRGKYGNGRGFSIENLIGRMVEDR